MREGKQGKWCHIGQRVNDFKGFFPFWAPKLSNFLYFDLTAGPEYGPSMKTWHVYLLRCSDNSLYCGVTTDPERRLAEHNKGAKKGAKYTRARLPVTIEVVEDLPDKKSAYQLEYAVKKKPALQKAAFLQQTALRMRNEFNHSQQQ